MNKRFYILLASILVALTGLIYVLSQATIFSPVVLYIGNGVIFLLSVVSYAIGSRFAASESNSAFMRGVLGGTFLKFFLAIIFALIYIVTNKGNINVADIIALMLMYVIYTTVETAFLAKGSRVK